MLDTGVWGDGVLSSRRYLYLKEECGPIFGVWPYSGETPVGFREETPNIWPPQRGVVFFLRYRLEERTPPPLCPAKTYGTWTVLQRGIFLREPGFIEKILIGYLLRGAP